MMIATGQSHLGGQQFAVASAVEGGHMHQLMEPELVDWAERTAIDAAPDKRGIWYGALAFWIVVAFLITARVMLLDVNKNQPASAQSVHQSVLVDAQPQAASAAKL